MLAFPKVGIVALVFALGVNVASAQSAQSVQQTSGRDSLWNGALIGAGAGVASVAALDAVFCENGFGGCDFPWVAVITLGGIGAAAGAGIDFLIGRDSNARPATVRVAPIIGPTRKGMLASVALPWGSPPVPPRARVSRPSDVQREVAGQEAHP